MRVYIGKQAFIPSSLLRRYFINARPQFIERYELSFKFFKSFEFSSTSEQHFLFFEKQIILICKLSNMRVIPLELFIVNAVALELSPPSDLFHVLIECSGFL